MASGIGAKLDDAPDDIPAHAYWFGEDQARYVVTVPAAKVKAVLERARAASVLVSRIGTTGGDAFALPGERALPVATLARDIRSLAAGLYGRRVTTLEPLRRSGVQSSLDSRTGSSSAHRLRDLQRGLHSGAVRTARQ